MELLGLGEASKVMESRIWLNPARDLLGCSVKERRNPLGILWDPPKGHWELWVTPTALGLGATQKSNSRDGSALAGAAHSALSSYLGYEYNVKKYGE